MAWATLLLPPPKKRISQNPKPVPVVYVCHPNVWETDAGGLLMSEACLLACCSVCVCLVCCLCVYVCVYFVCVCMVPVCISVCIVCVCVCARALVLRNVTLFKNKAFADVSKLG